MWATKEELLKSVTGSILRVAGALAVLLAIFAAGFKVAQVFQPPSPPTVVQFEPVACDCTPNCRVAGPNGLYLDLMKLSLTDLLYETNPQAQALLAEGRVWPSRGMTMIGMRRLESLQEQMETTLRENIPGDYIEAGAWRGGATIFMRAVLEAHGVRDRNVWVADSFEGLPPPPAGREKAEPAGAMAVSIEEVQANFRRFQLLDGQVKFLKGWFSDTLPKAPIQKLAILRVDADLYESTMDALDLMYDKVSPGGFIIVDDTSYEPCQRSVDDFRKKRNITAPIVKIDWTGIYWRKPAA
jgi:O-methyltransferase